MTSTTSTAATTTSTGVPAGRRRQARSAAVREALLDAALDEFSAHGFEAASTRTIATAAGTHQPQINYHFASKEDLWKATVDHLFARLDAAVAQELATEPARPGDRGQFAASLRAFVHAAAGLPQLNRIMVQEATTDSERLQWIVERHTRRRFELITGQWRKLRDAGVVADIDEAVLYYSLVGAASLAYVNAPEARLLGFDTLSDSFIEAHADALVGVFLGPNRATDR